MILPDGKNLNHEIVKAGFAWWFRKYAPKDKVLEELEPQARAARRGLWADPRPVPPWEWRKRVHATRNRFESDLFRAVDDPARSAKFTAKDPHFRTPGAPDSMIEIGIISRAGIETWRRIRSSILEMESQGHEGEF